jgi:hypothetical protein
LGVERNTEGILFNTNGTVGICRYLWTMDSYRMRRFGSFDLGREVCTGQIGVSNDIVLKYWGEVFRIDEFTIPEVWGGTMIKFEGEMKPRGRKCDLSISCWYP